MAAKTRRGAAPEYVSGTAGQKAGTGKKTGEAQGAPTGGQQPEPYCYCQKKPGKALQMDLPYVIVLTIAAVCTLYFCVSYLQLQSSIAARLNHIEALEASIEKKKADNDALETRINTSIDLDNIYKIATEELGMVYANKDQVRMYNKTESEYVRQYEDIPER